MRTVLRVPLRAVHTHTSELLESVYEFDRDDIIGHRYVLRWADRLGPVTSPLPSILLGRHLAIIMMLATTRSGGGMPYKRAERTGKRLHESRE